MAGITKNFIVKNGIQVGNNLIVSDAIKYGVGIGTSTIEYQLHVNGGIGATSLNVTGFGTIASLNSPNATITNFYSGIGTIAQLNAPVGVITSLTGTGVTYTTGNFTTANAATGNIVTGVVTSLSGTTATYGTGNLTTLNATTGNIVTGVVTSLSGTDLNYPGSVTLGITSASQLTSQNLNVSGISTTNSLNIDTFQVISSARQLQNIASLDTTTAATVKAVVANAPNTFTNLQVSGISTLGVTSITALTAQQLNVSGVATIGTLNVSSMNASSMTFSAATATDFTVSNNLYVAGIGTIVTGIISTLSGTIGTITTLNSTNGTIANLTGTNINYSGVSTFSGVRISSGIITATNSGIVTYYGDGSKLLNITASSYIQSDSNLPLLNPTGIVSTFNFVNTNGGTTYSGGIVSIDVGKTASGPSNAVQFKNASGIFSGSSNFTWNGSIVSIAGTCEATNFNTTSDLNFKENVRTVENALNIVSDLRGVRFDWKTTHQPTIGVIAQEVEEILPELVTSATHKTVNYNGIIGVLIEAIKELKTEVETLKNQINNQQEGS